MTSGMSFQENYLDATSDIAVLAGLTLGQDPGGSLSAVKRFKTRVCPTGERFSYASDEPLVLGLVLAGATRRNVSDYASEKLWMPLGAEADAAWLIDGTGQEITFAYFNAVLRDWARLGLMLAHDGMWQGKRIVPRDWLLASTGPGSPFPGYGYQVWLPSANRRVFALRGLRGQFVNVDPEAKLVLVQTAVREAPTAKGMRSCPRFGRRCRRNCDDDNSRLIAIESLPDRLPAGVRTTYRRRRVRFPAPASNRARRARH
jgi:CubicO group peptidase (beta-lactamase class C family)